MTSICTLGKNETIFAQCLQRNENSPGGLGGCSYSSMKAKNQNTNRYYFNGDVRGIYCGVTCWAFLKVIFPFILISASPKDMDLRRGWVVGRCLRMLRLIGPVFFNFGWRMIGRYLHVKLILSTDLFYYHKGLIEGWV